MKRVLLFLFILVSAITNAQETFDKDQIKYLITSETTVETNKYIGSDTHVAVPSSVEYNGKQYIVTAIGAESFSWTKVQSVDMPSTIEAIKDKAFQYAEINQVTLPSNLKTIGKSAYSSAKIEELTIPSSVTEIGENAFLSCSKLSRITFNEGLVSIGNGAFYHLPLITELILPNTLQTIGKAAFSKCKELQTLHLSDNLVSIGDAAFLECTKLNNVTFPNTLKTIGAEAFLKCKGITTLHLPASVETLGDSFMAATSVASITVDPASEHFIVKDNNALYGLKKNVLYLTLMKGLNELTIIDETIGVSGGAAWGSEIQTLNLPNSLWAIGDFAFFGTKITTVNLPSSLTFIGEQAFAETKLTEIVVPENITILSKGIFAKCEDLTTATLPSSITRIENLAFGYDTKLTKVIYKGSKVPEIADYSEDYYHPFYMIGSSPILEVPKGTATAFKDEHWDDFFSIIETNQGILHPIKIEPADGTKVNGYKPMTFTITFDEPISVVQENPDVALRKNAVFYPNSFTADGNWFVTLNSDKRSVNVWANDGDGSVQYYNFNEKIEYFLIIPSAIVKNAQGDMNERIIIKLVNDETTHINIPSNIADTTIESYYNINGQKLSTPQKGINIIKYANGKTKKVVLK